MEDKKLLWKIDGKVIGESVPCEIPYESKDEQMALDIDKNLSNDHFLAICCEYEKALKKKSVESSIFWRQQLQMELTIIEYALKDLDLKYMDFIKANNIINPPKID